LTADAAVQRSAAIVNETRVLFMASSQARGYFSEKQERRLAPARQTQSTARKSET
jgi:hypothetical protein